MFQDAHYSQKLKVFLKDVGVVINKKKSTMNLLVLHNPSTGEEVEVWAEVKCNGIPALVVYKEN